MPIYLASASPRRQELLRQVGIEFEVLTPAISEHRRAEESPRAYVQRLAVEKARFAAHLLAEGKLPRYPVLGADTAVVIDDDILGKPHDRGDGINMLRHLSGCTHEVLTALCVIHQDAEHYTVSVSKVTLRALTDADIFRYWETGEPLDKAGAYAIQGYAAGFVSRLEGSYSGVMGLPLYELMQILQKIGLSEGE